MDVAIYAVKAHVPVVDMTFVLTACQDVRLGEDAAGSGTVPKKKTKVAEEYAELMQLKQTNQVSYVVGCGSGCQSHQMMPVGTSVSQSVTQSVSLRLINGPSCMFENELCAPIAQLCLCHSTFMLVPMLVWLM